MNNKPGEIGEDEVRKEAEHLQSLCVQYLPVDHYLAIARYCLSKLRESEARHERSMLQVIDERERASEALSQAYYLIIGKSPEWSNLFGHSQALEEIDDAQTLLRKEIHSLQSQLDASNSISTTQAHEIQTQAERIMELLATVSKYEYDLKNLMAEHQATLQQLDAAKEAIRVKDEALNYCMALGLPNGAFNQADKALNSGKDGK